MVVFSRIPLSTYLTRKQNIIEIEQKMNLFHRRFYCQKFVIKFSPQFAFILCNTNKNAEKTGFEIK